MKIMIFGSNGQLGHDLVRVLSKDHELIPMVREGCDVSKLRHLLNCINTNKPEIVINCTAFHDVKACEELPDKAYLMNATVPSWMAQACKDIGAKFVHFSTDFVFSGDEMGRPYTEDIIPNPINVYGKSKRDGEINVLATNETALIFRVASLFGIIGPSGKKSNFVDTMIKKYDEQADMIYVKGGVFMNPTHTLDIALQVKKVLEEKISARGIFHCVSHGSCSWLEFAIKIFNLTGRSPMAKIQPVEADYFKETVSTPRYSVLLNMRLSELGLDIMPYWNDALEGYLKEKGYLK